MKHKARQFDMTLPGETFALVGEATTDGEQITKEKQDQERRRSEAREIQKQQQHQFDI